ncbi:alpha/beta fold hydrolase [Scytonema sp. NUACC26]|uniref:alpha/beta fold hydrolase n=1 Tax=Scytonema sp. NUACC26 TaxID=3140176 RepID=UPI0034DBC09A
MTQIKVEIPSVGIVIAEGNFPDNRLIVGYIHELFGTFLPPKDLAKFVDFSFCLPGYGSATLFDQSEGHDLTWEMYGKSIAKILSAIDKPIILVGSSKGVMVAIYATLEIPHLVEKLIFYRVPTFGEERTQIRNKYAEIAASIAGEQEFHQFLTSIRNKTSPEVLQVIEASGWKKAKKLYQGASLSDLNPLLLKNIQQPIVFIESTFDKFHSKNARDALFSLLSNSINKRIISIDELTKLEKM